VRQDPRADPGPLEAGNTAADRRADAVARLRRRYGDRVDPQRIQGVFDTTYETLRSAATITTFLPILAERVASRRLEHE
jgi:hypothetical protein